MKRSVYCNEYHGPGVFDVSAFEYVDWLKLGKFFFFKAIIVRGKPSAVIGKFEKLGSSFVRVR